MPTSRARLVEHCNDNDNPREESVVKLVPARLPDNKSGPPDYLVNVQQGNPVVLFTDPEDSDPLGQVQRVRGSSDVHVRVYDLETRSTAGVWCGHSRSVEQPGFIGGRTVHSPRGGCCLCPHSGKNELIQS
jgi:hypothetical protein